MRIMWDRFQVTVADGHRRSEAPVHWDVFLDKKMPKASDTEDLMLGTDVSVRLIF